MGNGPDMPKFRRVAEAVRCELGARFGTGRPLPSDATLARQFGVSVRTVREALLVLESDGLVRRRHGVGTIVLRAGARPVALYCELNLLHPDTPRFYPLVFDLIRARLAAAGLSTRLYTGRSRTGEWPDEPTSPELVADAEAGRLSAVVALTTQLNGASFDRLRREGLPLLAFDEGSAVNRAFSPVHLIGPALSCLAAAGRRRIGLITWTGRHASVGTGELEAVFRRELAAAGLTHVPAWSRTDLSHDWPGSGWEALREIWTSRPERPDGLIVTDENYLPGLAVALQELHIEVPRELLVVSHATRGVEWHLPLRFGRVEMDTEAFADAVVAELFYVLGRGPAPDLSRVRPYRVAESDGPALLGSVRGAFDRMEVES